MSKVKIITDSCCSLSQEELNRLGVDYVSMTILVDDLYCEAFDCPIKNEEEFFATIKAAKKVSTGCVNVQTFTDIFEKYAHRGYDVVYMGLSSGLSSTYSNAVSAAEYVNKTCGKHIWVVDTLTGSFGETLFVNKAVQMVSENKTAEEIFNALDKNKINTRVFFMPYDLQFLAKSGRLNKIVATVGTMIKLVPILSANEEGKLKLCNKAIGRKKSLKNLGNMFLSEADLNSEEKIYIGHTGQIKEAEELSSFIKEHCPNKTVEIGYIDFTMGCCCGPETLALFFIKKN